MFFFSTSAVVASIIQVSSKMKIFPLVLKFIFLVVLGIFSHEISYICEKIHHFCFSVLRKIAHFGFGTAAARMTSTPICSTERIRCRDISFSQIKTEIHPNPCISYLSCTCFFVFSYVILTFKVFFLIWEGVTCFAGGLDRMYSGSDKNHSNFIYCIFCYQLAGNTHGFRRPYCHQHRANWPDHRRIDRCNPSMRLFCGLFSTILSRLPRTSDADRSISFHIG